MDCFRQFGLLVTGVYVGNYEDVLLLEDGITAEFNLISGSSQNCEKRLLASSCVSVRPHGTTRLPLDGFSWSLIFIFPNCVENIEVSLKFHKINEYYPWRLICIFDHKSVIPYQNEKCWWDKSCTENQITHFMFNSLFFRKSCRLWDNVEKCNIKWVYICIIYRYTKCI
jgi:hypothetical protein